MKQTYSFRCNPSAGTYEVFELATGKTITRTELNRAKAYLAASNKSKELNSHTRLGFV